ncbi:MAG TPA: glutaredoxin family protein [Steroidobacteraceae bacterium]|nr:glutaredoxin family protein [Steroidobacteraceae bacterium]HRX89921.1 glutaredoxin family protein [Steroidobacteraceae bacterium]
MSLVFPAGLAVLTREGCGLCETMFEELGALRHRLALPAVTAIDIESDQHLLQRYVLEVPVLLLDGSPVCHGQLDVPALERALRDS